MATEKGDGTPDLTLSFLDVIANGLGCLLVLFFLTTLIRTELAWPLTAAATATPVDSDQDPFVILVTPSTPDALLPPMPDGEVPWKVEGGPEQKVAAGTQVGWGPDHAILVLDRRPPATSVVRLYLPAGSGPVECQWFTAAGAGRSTLAPAGPGPWIQVWPRQEGQK